MRPERATALLLSLACAVGVAGAGEKTPRAPAILSSDGSSNVMLVQTFLGQGKIEEADQRAQAALQSDPDSALPHVSMALVRSARKQDDKAQAEFNRALALEPDNGVVLNAYGAWLCGRGDRDGADAAFQKALRDPRAPAIQPLLNAARCALLARNLSKGEGYLRRAADIAPKSRFVLLMLAETQLQQGRPLDARAFVERSDALGPDAQTLWIAARVEDAAGDAESAARYRKRLAEEFPNFAPNRDGARKP